MSPQMKTVIDFHLISDNVETYITFNVRDFNVERLNNSQLI